LNHLDNMDTTFPVDKLVSERGHSTTQRKRRENQRDRAWKYQLKLLNSMQQLSRKEYFNTVLNLADKVGQNIQDLIHSIAKCMKAYHWRLYITWMEQIRTVFYPQELPPERFPLSKLFCLTDMRIVHPECTSFEYDCLEGCFNIEYKSPETMDSRSMRIKLTDMRVIAINPHTESEVILTLVHTDSTDTPKDTLSSVKLQGLLDNSCYFEQLAQDHFGDATRSCLNPDKMTTFILEHIQKKDIDEEFLLDLREIFMSADKLPNEMKDALYSEHAATGQKKHRTS
jgi:hypothetical protein